MATYYEWDIEELDEHSDILDHNHNDKLSSYSNKVWKEAIDNLGTKFDIALVKNKGNEEDGLLERTWAYVDFEDGVLRLSLEFDDGTKVPVRFHKELEAILKNKY